MVESPENIKYYDEVAEAPSSAENRSAIDPRARDLWQTGQVSTDGNGPSVHEVAPVFAQARADAVAANPNATAEEVEAAQDEADRLRTSTGFASATGPAAGIYDDPSLEDKVPAENFSPAPEVGEDERDANQVAADEAAGLGSAVTVPTDEVDQRPPAVEESAPEVEEPVAEVEPEAEPVPEEEPQQ